LETQKSFVFAVPLKEKRKVVLEYCENIAAEIPVMFIDKAIGDTTDEKGKIIEKGIDGDKFMKEMLYLSDTLNKKTIEVWINSPGGLVTKGQSIYHGILTSKANVNTICYGIAASISGVIFQAGKVRKMTDFATLMYHPAYNPDGTKDKGLDAMNDSVIKMIASRTGKTEDETWKIMNAGGKTDKGTWLDAKTAKENGFCDEVIDSSDLNNKYNVVDATTIHSKWQIANRILNRITEPKINKMEKRLEQVRIS
jgi:ATP-dependent protease ClpP protease subunit